MINQCQAILPIKQDQTPVYQISVAWKSLGIHRATHLGTDGE
ncbi:hypothetical protein RIF25_08615 [Thermosynechococcaceae cyanobacterium BACA0444]|uniref:Uncharacterized protein n=1 Tax=Pseudocalidococcus azoricus BACA0444 TaxID=2918990 RepID=A0AAE4JWB0_9CYAN|nr:hypothetical protein [Pseudocalidococcus azoricus]MDS3860876.1 hypothetical protein [Pseudocalidococcus azoricus BACA0444]